MKRLFKRLMLAALIATLTFSATAAYAATDTSAAAATTTTTTTATTTTTTTTTTTKTSTKTGWYKVSGKWTYYNKGKVKFTSNPMHTAFTKIKSKKSSTNYYVVVDRTNFTVFVFKKSSGSWVPVKAMKCSVGRKSTPTYAGTYTMVSRWNVLGFSGNSSWEFYPILFSAKHHLCFHSVLYYPMAKYKNNSGKALAHASEAKLKNGKLGAAISHGCVRLSLANSKWLWTYCPNKTAVLVY